MRHRRHLLLAGCALAGVVAGEGCAPAQQDASGRPASGDTVVLYVAASLTRAMRPALDSFTARTGIVVLQESGASLEQARKLTELGRIPDMLILADEEVFPRYLAPAHLARWTSFAANRMVIAYSPRSRYAGEISADNWMDVLARSDVEVGRTDSAQAPAGYRTLIMLRLAERHYRRPGLASRLLANAPPRNIRGNAAELATLLAAGELDYIYEYRSLALSNGFSFVELPREIDLSDPAHAAGYATASVTVRGPGGTPASIAGAPILYAFGIPDRAPHPEAARRFEEFMRSRELRELLRAAHVEMLDAPIDRQAHTPGTDASGV